MPISESKILKIKTYAACAEDIFSPSFKFLVIFPYVYFSISLPIFGSLVLSNL